MKFETLGRERGGHKYPNQGPWYSSGLGALPCDPQVAPDDLNDLEVAPDDLNDLEVAPDDLNDLEVALGA